MGVDGGEEFKTTKQLQYRVLGCQECCISRRKKKSVKSRQLSEPCDFEEGVRGASLRKNMKWKIKKRNCVVWEDNVSGGGSDRKILVCFKTKNPT